MHQQKIHNMPRFNLLTPTITLLLFTLQLISFQSIIVQADIAQNAPIQTLQFTPNITHRTNMCEKQTAFRGGLLKFEDLLRNETLS